MKKFAPQPGPQAEFLRRGEDEVLYGGAKGGGKSYALMLESGRQVDNSGYRALILRRTFPRLQELIDRSKEIYPHLGGTYAGQTHTWTFPSGAIIRFGHCQNKGDERNYQGHEYAFIGFDQLEEFLESQYLFICAQNRTTAPGVRCYVRATANPGDVGHAWVKKHFIDNKQPFNTYKVEFELPTGDTVSRTSSFIPATVYDNKILLKAQPQYLATLFSLPEKERKALLEGNWDVFEGQYFAEFDRTVHVIKPFTPDPTWRKFRCGDYGYTAPSAVYWVAIAPNGDLYAYRELYKNNLTFSALGKEINRMTPKEEAVDYTVFDPSIWAKNGATGETGSEILFNQGVHVMRGDNNRIAGWLRIREYLKDPEGKSHLFITENCVSLIRTLPSLVHDKIKNEDVDSDCEDHASDALRYGVMSRPRARELFVDSEQGLDASQIFLKRSLEQEKQNYMGEPTLINFEPRREEFDGEYY